MAIVAPRAPKLVDVEGLDLSSPYFLKHLITYIGNKRKLLPFINLGIQEVKKQLNKTEVTSFDGFSGSGAVSRLLKYHSSLVVSNDFEGYTETINKAYLANRSTVDEKGLVEAIAYLNAHKFDQTGSAYFISRNYAPGSANVEPGERAFYTASNARIIDNIRYLLDTEITEPVRVFCLANLLIKASIHNNTSGVFKGFHKKEGVGHFGGNGQNALGRIMAEIQLDAPIFSDVECEVRVTRSDTNAIVGELEELDLAYYDPPYNQHPYGSNYFMLNIINGGKPVKIQDGVSGIAEGWQRSDYNRARLAELALDNLLRDTKAKFVLISYNDEGIIPQSKLRNIVEKHGTYKLLEQQYNTFRGSRNLANRSTHVKELLWLVKKR